MFISHLSIRTILLVIITVLNLLIATPLAITVYQSLNNYRNAQEIHLANSVLTALYKVKKNLSLERANTLSVFYASEPIKERLKKSMLDNRRAANDQLQQAVDLLKGQKYFAHATALADVQKQQRSYEIFRQRVDIALRTNQIGSPLFDVEAYFAATTNYIQSINNFINEYSRTILPYNPDLGRQLRFTYMVWEVSDFIGREYALLGQVIAQNRYPDASEIEKLITWRAQTHYGLDIIHRTTYLGTWNESLLPLIEEAQTHYFMTFDQIKTLFEPQVKANPQYPISASLWLDMAEQVIETLNEMTDAVLKINKTHIDIIKSNAERAILWSFFLLTCSFLLSFYTWWIITIRVIRPVNSMINALYLETKGKEGTSEQSEKGDEIAKLAQVLEVFQDNARQLQIERDNAQAANVAKTEFLTNISHEIRTPMNVVVGLTEILGNSQPLTSKQSEFIKTLEVSAQSLLALINDLLDFSKIEDQNFQLEKIPFDLHQLVEDIILLLSVKAKEKGLSLTTQIGDIENLEFIGDPTRIRQILLNLCSNAVKFTEKGQITLEIQPVGTGVPNAVQNLMIRVSDTGIGIPAEKLGSIFEKFTQADATITRRYGGTGLGLAITKGLVDILGGTIQVQSTINQGTTFTVYLPLTGYRRKNTLPVSTSGQSPAVTQTPHYILLVEDYHPNIIVTGTFLEQFGFEYDVAENGPQALQKYMTKDYDVILMDVQMPGMDGFQITNTIREYERSHKRRPVRIVGLTAHASQKDRESCLKSGMNDYLAKPFDPKNLYNKIVAAA
ncbi:MAG: ATP-binding protein [Alphaproteobacteria bacterium]|nr:ATP-binding protein [Alphaproteobacteria bacterium]